jgi:hypothetical protein
MTRPGLLVLMSVALAPGCSWTSADAVDASEVAVAATLEDVPPSTLRTLDVPRMMGTWYVVLTNYDFWQGERNTTIVYEPIEGPSGVRPDLVKLSDVVAYGPSGSESAVVGVDLQDPTLAGHFQWRGEGLLNLIVSQWFVVAVDPDYEWLVTYFADSNLGTGSGMDVYSRKPCLSLEQEAAAIRAIFSDAWTAKQGRGLFRVPHDDAPACRREVRSR